LYTIYTIKTYMCKEDITLRNKITGYVRPRDSILTKRPKT